MTHVPATGPTGFDPAADNAAAAGAVDRLHVDLACGSCGYRLLGEPLDGECPRCETRIASTVRAGDMVLCEAAYLSTLARGLLIVQVGLVTQFVVAIAIVMLSIVLQPVGRASPSWFNGWDAASSITGVIVAIVIAQGWWMFTEPQRPGPEPAGFAASRRVVRAAVITHALFTGLALLGRWLLVLPALTAYQNPLGAIVALAGFGALATLGVQFFAVTTAMGHASRGMRDARLARVVKRRSWTIPLWATIGLLAFGIGPIVAWVQYFDLIGRVRRRLNMVIEAHRIAEAALE